MGRTLELCMSGALNFQLASCIGISLHSSMFVIEVVSSL